jgi:glycosyltransferase involved in cell wall biosynthesis
MAGLVARGKFLYEDGRKFHARGVSYGTFAPNSRGEQFPEPERAAADFALMRELGANVVRTYVVPPPWLLEQAAKAGLRVMAGIPWPQHLAFLDSREMTREIREVIRRAVEELRGHREALFAIALGNEIRADIVRWHGPRAVSRFLAELYDIGKQLAPDLLFTYASYPSTEYLDLSFLDLLSFNVYLHREDDYRRYLTHLMGLAGEQPLVLSETGMDTIREGEREQAELFAWQSRAAFELGLAGFVAFAFTDEWHTGGADVTDWAFGITRRDRSPKPSFAALTEVFRGELPPALKTAPHVSVVVAAHDAAPTLGSCLASMRDLNYPSYDVTVVDDGSRDSTAAIAEQSGYRTLKLEHRGLAAARNAGVTEARGDIVAFIDADASAERDWLYHLAEAITRRGAAAAGGPNFAPAPGSAFAAAMTAAPGLPREVVTGDDRLSQLCGCNMAVTKAALGAIGGFDPAFERAGDDVDLSWRLADRGEMLAYAAGATVIHQRRTSLGAYLAQQRGYGEGEGLLYHRYPLRGAADGGIYGGGSWLQAVLGTARIYYGAFGRGLFQSIYAAGSAPALELPLSAWWIAVSLLLLIAGSVSRLMLVLGAAGIAATLLAATAAAALAPLPRAHRNGLVRAWLWILNFLGPLVRSFARERAEWRIAPDADAGSHNGAQQFESEGEFAFLPGAPDGGAPAPAESPRILAAMRTGLARRGLAVAVTDGYQAYDLEIVLAPAVRVPINALRARDGRVNLRWRMRPALRRVAIVCVAAIVVLAAAGLTLNEAVTVVAIGAAAVAGLAYVRARRIAAILASAAREAATALNLKLAIVGEDPG